ncbi:DNA translocase FtsK 4TM domain-containing protein [Solitalea sp. MAHUQ-68]|uniref:DNA translocase FtsK 4TM domain-containing protein n=1 Tax=Solitalea agri TaxID=2953739 RepID=A0A9X2F4K2_9SPHI|nr:DNA translocase FtsK 4TM domain-containing protein [Solitalea agri]MCO4294120.1 DNA translocase FtsK 4TM domain-containing protein [Solitalea agri]
MQERTNRFRNETNEPQAEKISQKPKIKYPPKQEEEKKPFFSLPEVNPKLIKITGLFMLIMSVYFLVAFTSYVLTWGEDQSVVMKMSWSKIFAPQENPVENWMGLWGAMIAHQFIYKWFGVASFVFVFVFFVVGYRLLFKVAVFPIIRSLAYAFFFLVFLSLFAGYINSFFNPMPHFLEGVFGYQLNVWLGATLGKTGILGVLIFAALVFVIIAFNPDFSPKKKPVLAPEAEPIRKNKFDDLMQEEEIDFTPRREYSSTNGPIKPNLAYLEEELTPEVKTIEFATNNAIEFESEPVVNEPVEIELPPIQRPEAPVEVPVDSVEDDLEFSVEHTEEEKLAQDLVSQHGEFDPTLDLASYKYPTIELLDNHGSNKIHVDQQELEANKNKIVDTLGHYGIEIDKIKATIGPTVTLYEIIPAPGVRISKIKNLEDDIALSLAALGIRIIAPIPGKGTIGIEVPNQHPELVAMRSVMATEKFQASNMDLPVALGKTISNEVFIADLAKMPHLLMAGATGQGKSVGINALISSLLYKKHPSQLKFVFVDPKKVELTLYKKIERHFLAKLPGEGDAIITDTKKVVNTLNSLCIEMDNRYELLKDAGVRNLKEYNQKFVSRRLNPENGHRYLPYIVLVIDEFADLIMTAGKEVETPIARLAQLARAIGIHLVIATQRPSVNVITGIIKANFPARLAFRVTAKIDSRTILDAGGADQLIGRGDMLFSTGADLIRLQCAFLDTPEVEKICEYIGSQRGYTSAYELPEYVGEDGEGSVKDFDPSDRDALFEDAARLVVIHQQGSTSLIQRKLKLGYNRAGRIIDQLEAAGIVGPFEGSKAREVLYPDEYSLEQYLNNLNGK